MYFTVRNSKANMYNSLLKDEMNTSVITPKSLFLYEIQSD